MSNRSGGLSKNSDPLSFLAIDFRRLQFKFAFTIGHIADLLGCCWLAGLQAKYRILQAPTACVSRNVLFAFAVYCNEVHHRVLLCIHVDAKMMKENNNHPSTDRSGTALLLVDSHLWLASELATCGWMA